MKIVKILILIAIIGFGVQWWKNHKAHSQTTAETSPSGFVPVAMPSGAKADTVVIFAPINCPSDGAQRADALAAELDRLNIPNERSSSFSLSIRNPNEEEKTKVEQATKVLKGKIPAVFINGMAKSNPSVDEVALEYERTR